MFCTKCGANLPDGTKFCTVCGASMEASAPVEPIAPAYAPETETPAETNKFDVDAVKDQLLDTLQPVTKKCKSVFSNKKARLGIIAGIVLLVVIGVVAALLFGGNGFVTTKQEVTLLENDGTLNIAVNGKLIKDTIDLPTLKDRNGDTIKYDGETQYYSYGSRSSMDGKNTAIRIYGTTYKTDKGTGSITEETDSELYVLKGKKLIRVAEDVDGYRISVNGKGIVYYTENEKGEDDYLTTYTLYLYNVSNKKTTTISSDAYGPSFEVSPDGKSVAYYEASYDKDAKKTEYSLMLFSGKDSSEITSFDNTDKKEIDLIAIANKGKYIYAIETKWTDSSKSESTMYCYNNKGKATKLGETNDDDVYLNKDHTQIMFYDEGNTYIATKGKAAEKAAKKSLELIAPSNAAYYDSTTMPVDNFYGKTYMADADKGYDVYMIKKGGKSNKLVDSGYNISVDESGDYIYFVTDKDDLKCVKASMSQTAKSKAVEIAEDVYSYTVTSNRKYVYYITDDSELLCVNGKKGGKATEVCGDDVRAMFLVKNDVLFYAVGDNTDTEFEIFATKNGKKSSSVLDDVTDADWGDDYMYFMCDEDVYVTSGKKMKKLELN